MMDNIKPSTQIDSELVCNYFRNLVNQFFKILPMREIDEVSLPIYIESLYSELLGCGNVVDGLNKDAYFLTLLSILRYMMDNPDCSVHSTKRQVFKAISICNKLKAQFTEGGA